MEDEGSNGALHGAVAEELEDAEAVLDHVRRRVTGDSRGRRGGGGHVVLIIWI